MRSFCRWVNKEHKDKPVTVDLLIVFDKLRKEESKCRFPKKKVFPIA